jgi:endonuclease YncB( thermonuclease family)
LAIDRPRRIFRSSLPRRAAKGMAVVIVAALMVAAGVSLAMLPRREATPTAPVATPATPVAPTEEMSAEPAQIAVVDGGTLRLGDRVVRLLGVEPPPRGTSCGSRDCGAAATDALAAMVREAPVACRITGLDPLGRPYAICQARGTELNSATIAAGWARADTAQPELRQAEQTARAERRGVWSLDADIGW